MPLIHEGETPSDWKYRIWDRLMHYRKSDRLQCSLKREMIARKMLSKYGYSEEAICYSCNQLIYDKIVRGSDVSVTSS